METVILPDATALASFAADLIVEEAANSERLLLGLSGGSTPLRMHLDLSIRNIEWDKVRPWISDERWVPPYSEESNARMARDSLTDRVGVELLAPDTRGDNPADSAADFSSVVRPMLEDPASRSVVVLGLGTDGHTASLFPGTRALDVLGASYVANFVPQLDTWRLTATYDLIGLADIVIFLVSGESKASVLQEMADGIRHPAARVTARERVLWLVDQPAASRLD